MAWYHVLWTHGSHRMKTTSIGRSHTGSELWSLINYVIYTSVHLDVADHGYKLQTKDLNLILL